jgi:hypothetical protein
LVRYAVVYVILREVRSNPYFTDTSEDSRLLRLFGIPPSGGRGRGDTRREREEIGEGYIKDRPYRGGYT